MFRRSIVVYLRNYPVYKPQNYNLKSRTDLQPC